MRKYLEFMLSVSPAIVILCSILSLLTGLVEDEMHLDVLIIMAIIALLMMTVNFIYTRIVKKK